MIKEEWLQLYPSARCGFEGCDFHNEVKGSEKLALEHVEKHHHFVRMDYVRVRCLYYAEDTNSDRSDMGTADIVRHYNLEYHTVDSH